MNHEIAEAILNWEDHDEAEFFKEVTEKEITSQSRWNTYYQMIYKDTRNDTYWRLSWSRGSTEMQDYDGNQDIEVDQVEPRQVMVTQYFDIRSK